MHSKFTNVMFMVAMLALYLLASCIPTATPTPPSLPPSDGLSWAIHFQAQSGGYTVTKFIGADDGDLTTEWHPEITEVLSCTEHEVSYKDGAVEFKQGSYIQCDDVDLNDYVSAPLDDYIGYNLCQFGSPAAGEICMQTSPLLLTAIVQVPEAVIDTYPIFFYPQSFSSDSQSLNFSTTLSDGGGQSIDFNINYLDPTGVMTLSQQVWWDIAWVQDFQNPQIERDLGSLGIVKYSLERSEYDPIQVEIEEENIFEFSTQTVTFYFGDVNGEMEPESIMLLKDLFFDPSDSCGGCN